MLLMRTYRPIDSDFNSFSNASAKNARGISPPSLLNSSFTQHYLVAVATSIDKSGNNFTNPSSARNAFS